MKEFCKNHRKELAFVIFYLVYVYVVCYVLCSSYRYWTFPVSSRKSSPSLLTWAKYGAYIEYGVLYLPGLFLILAWISLINEKKWLYGLVTLMICLDFYFVVIKFFHANWWIYNIVLIVSLILPLLYYFGKQKQWMFWISNIIVYLSACWWEIWEFWEPIIKGIRAKAHVLVYIVYLPKVAMKSFLRDLYCFMSTPFFSKFLDAEKVSNILWAIMDSNTVWIDKMCNKFLIHEVKYFSGSAHNYYWYIQIFLLTAIFILGTLLSYSKFSNKKDKIIVEKKKLS